MQRRAAHHKATKQAAALLVFAGGVIGLVQARIQVYRLHRVGQIQQIFFGRGRIMLMCRGG